MLTNSSRTKLVVLSSSEGLVAKRGKDLENVFWRSSVLLNGQKSG